MRRSSLRAAAFAVVALAAPAAARAYPQFQLSTGNPRCNQCHFAPAGGGLINGYGREEAGDTISMGGNGGLLHGLWQPPGWLALGGDLRGALVSVAEDSRRGVDTVVFPMQADLYARVAVDAFSVYASVGLRGATRPRDQSFASRVISREHYLMWRPSPSGVYLRAGRFYAPYGLRLAEHTAYVRRFLGFDLLEETYNLSGGVVRDDWEIHLTAFMPDFVLEPVGQRGAGGAAYYERRAGDSAAWGAQARVSVGAEDTRATGGLVGKLWLAGPRIQLLGETDLVRQSFEGPGAARWQWLGYLGAAWLPRPGFMVQLMLERWDEDLAVKGVARSAAGAELQWFPTAHVELSLFGRVAMIGSGSSDGSFSELVLFQLHYYI